jgi:hypothetical protein
VTFEEEENDNDDDDHPENFGMDISGNFQAMMYGCLFLFVCLFVEDGLYYDFVTRIGVAVQDSRFICVQINDCRVYTFLSFFKEPTYIGDFSTEHWVSKGVPLDPGGETPAYQRARRTKNPAVLRHGRNHIQCR